MTAAGVAASATGAFAQAAPADATVNFTGTVGSVCTFSNVVAGSLEFDGNFRLAADTAGGGPGGMGTPGSVDLDCTGDVNVSVSLPQENGSTTDLITNAVGMFGVAEFTGGPVAFTDMFNSNSTGTVAGPVSETLSVGMMVDADQPIPSGAYNYNVMVTATPL